MMPMDHIALRIGWVAVIAARLENVIGLIVLVLRGQERADDLLGRRWSDVHKDAQKLYGLRLADARSRRDHAEQAAASSFLEMLSESHGLMMQRHLVLHSLWTADSDVVQLDGTSTSIRSRGRREQREWSLEDLHALCDDINDAHQQALAEFARVLQADGIVPLAGTLGV